MEAQLKARKAALQEEFDTVTSEIKTLSEEGSKLNKRLSELRARQVQISGAYQEVKNLLDTPKKK